MAGAISRTTTIAAAEPLSTLGPKLPQLMDDATLTGLSDAEADAVTIILRRQASAPSSVADDFWHDTNSFTLRYYTGASGFERWQPVGVGMALKNATGGSRVSGDVVGVAGTPAAMSINNDAAGALVGVAGEAFASNAFGLVRMNGKATVTARNTMTRGDFIKGTPGVNTNFATSNGTTLDGSFGIALASAVSTASYALPVYLFAYNKT